MNDISVLKSQVRLQVWAAMVSECRQSGMTVEAWCKSQNLNSKTYYYRLKKVREAALANITPDQFPEADETQNLCFKKLEVQPSVQRMSLAVTVHLPYATVEVSNDASQRTLEAVFLALRSTC